MELKQYLVNDLEFDISTGYIPVIVNDSVVKSRQALPKITWHINFGDVKEKLKNTIEHIIFTEPNNTFIISNIGPSYYIVKEHLYWGEYIILNYYMTYIFEYDYYGKFVNRPLSYVEDGTDHLIEGVIRVPINQSAIDPPIVIPENTAMPRKLFFQESKIRLRHKYNGIYNFKAVFSEQAGPISSGGLYVVGETYVDNLEIC